MIMELDGVKIPYEVVEGVEYYPIKYVLENYLDKSNSGIYRNELYAEYIKRLEIDYSFKGTTSQEAYCMNKEGWKIYLERNKTNKNKTNLKLNRRNILCEYFGFDDLVIKNNVITKQDQYIKDCIKESKKLQQGYIKCSICGISLPHNSDFFFKDNRMANNLSKTCRMCDKNNASSYFMKNEFARIVYSELGDKAYVLYRDNIILFYDKYCHEKDFKLNIKNKDNQEEIILNLAKYYYNKGIIDNNINYSDLKHFLNVDFTSSHFPSNNKIIEFVSDNDCKLRPWKYNKYNLGRSEGITLNDINNILKRYIHENNIVIKDILNYKEYELLLRKSRLTKCVYSKCNSIVEFFVQYYGYQYAGFKYCFSSGNYYKKKENRIFDMKWLIEKELELDIHKIPLYITKTMLSNRYKSLYNLLYKGKYYKNLFEWINECYPDMFTINDFEINPYRSNFDSLEESQIDEQLRLCCKNVIYNSRNTEDTVNINGMIPDWIILTNKGCYLVEYFGLHSESNNIKTSHRLIRYQNKIKIKKGKYKELEAIGYNHLYIYPKDIRHGFDGLINKLKEINN